MTEPKTPTFRLYWQGEIETKTTELLNNYTAQITAIDCPNESRNIGLNRIDGICELAESLGFRCEYDPNSNAWKVVENDTP